MPSSIRMSTFSQILQAFIISVGNEMIQLLKSYFRYNNTLMKTTLRVMKIWFILN